MDYPHYYLQEFKKYLALQTSSVNTIKNYLSDLRLFFSYIVEKRQHSLTPQSLPGYISADFLKSYEEFLSQTNPPATTKRRVSSLKKFIDYCATQDISPAPVVSAAPPPAPAPYLITETPEIPPAVSSPVSYPMSTEPVSPTPPDYSRISHPLPPDLNLTPTPPPDNISQLVQSLADQSPAPAGLTPESTSATPTITTPPDHTPYQPSAIPSSATSRTPPSPYVVALASFLITFLVTFLISLYITGL